MGVLLKQQLCDNKEPVKNQITSFQDGIKCMKDSLLEEKRKEGLKACYLCDGYPPIHTPITHAIQGEQFSKSQKWPWIVGTTGYLW